MAEKDRTDRVGIEETANDQFKQGFGNWFWGSVALATLLHLGIFAFFPALQADDVSFETEVSLTIDLPPEVDIPPPPEQIARPATPVVSETMLDEDVTIAPTTFDTQPVNDLPPPPPGATQRDVSLAPAYTPMTEEPVLENRAEVQRLLKLYYPPLLRDAGLGGQTTIWFYIDTQGRVEKTQVKVPSDFPQLDEAALRVAKEMQFKPAKNRDKIVAVWVSIPIVFTATGSG